MADDLKALTRRWFEEVWNKRRAEAIDEMFDENGLAYGLAEDGGPLRGTDGFKAFHAAYTSAFPDIRIQVDDLLQEEDRCAARFSSTATHSGEGIGIAATHRPVTFTGMSFTRWRGGKIVEGWNNVDIAGILRQIETP